MRTIIITGESSYIGQQFANWAKTERYNIIFLSLRDEKWKQLDFSGVSAILHTAALVHKSEKKHSWKEYEKINTTLSLELANKAKAEGVPHFVFLSTMAVFGMETGQISKNTKPNPKTWYAKSKHLAEIAILQLANSSFNVAIVRPPMVYGKGCKGNFQKLLKLAKMTPVFPKVVNQRSMIFIDHLSDFLLQLLQQQKKGIFHPQNKDYVCTTHIIELFSQHQKKPIYFSKGLGHLVQMIPLGPFIKLFGNLTYHNDLADNVSNLNFETTLKKSLS